ncbi:MAG: hypothetical protein JOZ41_05490 [Chloroflexi bacterium]|nr:hypothetical protein [Chloroflexota bacterium]
MDEGYITEAAFLVVELRYTMAQLEVQLRYLDEIADPQDLDTIGRVLDAMGRDEARYQQVLARLLRAPAPIPGDGAGDRAGFVRRRHETLSLLETWEEDWPPPLVGTVKELLGRDRENLTALANRRGEILARREGRRDGEPTTPSRA